MKKQPLFALAVLFCTTLFAQSIPGRIEAENASLGGGTGINTNHAGYSGSGFIDNFIAYGAYTEFSFSVAEEGTYYVTLRYANGGTTTKTLSLYVNGTDVKQTQLPTANKDWDHWMSKTELLTLNSGTNIIRYQYDPGDTGWINLDYIWVSKNTDNGVVNTSMVNEGLGIVLQKYVQLPNTTSNAVPRLNTFAFAGNRKFVGEEHEGNIYELTENSQNGTSYSLFFNVATAVFSHTGRNLDITNAQHGGLRGLAFHPEFASNGLFYTSIMEARPANPAHHHYLSDDTQPIAADAVLVEWTYDFTSNQVNAGSYREVFRVGMPVYDHPIKQIAFNTYAVPGDEDYGLLYITHGDGSVQSATAGGGQNNDALGKLLRINPLKNGNDPYSVPATNPFVNNSAYLDEIYALGFRNPHTLSFNKDPQGNVHLIVADVGRDNIEELNKIVAGGNYGWADREGTFVHHNDGGGIVQGVSPLPENENTWQYEYPVVQWGHRGSISAGFVGQAIAGGYVFSDNQKGIHHFIHTDFAVSGQLFYNDFQEMVTRITSLDASDPSRDHPSELTQSSVKTYDVYFDHDQNPLTSPIRKASIKELMKKESSYDGSDRADLRFGRDQEETIYILNKRNGWIYKITDIGPTNGMLASLEAEDATTNASVGNGASGYRGTGFVEWVDTPGDFITFQLTVPANGYYLADLRYAAATPNDGSTHRTLSVYVNNTFVKQERFPYTGSTWNDWGDQTTGVMLTKGLNTITYQYNTGDTGFINLDYLDLRTYTYEAEDATTNATVGNGASGYRGSGFVEWVDTAGDSIAFQITAPANGYYLADLRYAAATPNDGSTHRTLSIYANGILVKQESFSYTGSTWNDWGNRLTGVMLTEGPNTITYKYNSGDTGLINLDYLDIRASTYEAEDAQTNADIGNGASGYRGSGFVEYVTDPGDSITFQVAAPANGLYQANLRYAASTPNDGTTYRTLSIYANGTLVKQASFPYTGSTWNDWGNQLTGVMLTEGLNTITYRYNAGDTGYINLDYMTITPHTGGTTRIALPNASNALTKLTGKVYPNPVTNELILEYSDTSRHLHVTLMSFAGEVIKTYPYYTQTQKILMAELPKGMYLLQIYDGEHTTVHKIVKQ